MVHCGGQNPAPLTKVSTITASCRGAVHAHASVSGRGQSALLFKLMTLNAMPAAVFEHVRFSSWSHSLMTRL